MVGRSQLGAEAMSGTSETYTQTWPGVGGDSKDVFHLAINKQCFSFRDLRVPVTRSSLPIFQGVGRGGLEWGCLETRMGSFQGVPLPKRGGNFLRMGRVEVSRKKIRFQKILPPEKA